MGYIYILVGGIPTPLKNHGVQVSWDDDIPIYDGTIKFMFQTTQPDYMMGKIMVLPFGNQCFLVIKNV